MVPRSGHPCKFQPCSTMHATALSFCTLMVDVIGLGFEARNIPYAHEDGPKQNPMFSNQSKSLVPRIGSKVVIIRGDTKWATKHSRVPKP